MAIDLLADLLQLSIDLISLLLDRQFLLGKKVLELGLLDLLLLQVMILYVVGIVLSLYRLWLGGLLCQHLLVFFELVDGLFVFCDLPFQYLLELRLLL
jgi:hypothetical protein